MKIPARIRQKIIKRAKLQTQANSVMQEITSWLEENNLVGKVDDINIYSGYCTYTEPSASATSLIQDLERLEI